MEDGRAGYLEMHMGLKVSDHIVDALVENFFCILSPTYPSY